jgi:enoyl-CoA hydratase/carnithine racemase
VEKPVMTEIIEAPVLFETLASGNHLYIGIVTLNVPKTLNSLSAAMVDLLLPQLRAWQAVSKIACVVLRGSGDRALCAGGDVVQLRNSSLERDGKAEAFFEQEYRLDYLIHTYSKPIIAWGHGVVMGGGLGLLAGASHRVVTAQTRLAMPEVTIGLYPDVGGTWFLNRMPGRTGLFLALTGAAINASDTLFLGIADRFLDHAQWPELISSLTAINWGDAEQRGGQISHILRDLEARAGERPANNVRDHYDTIQQLTDADSLDAIVEKITRYNGDDEWLKKAAATLASGCPVTIRVIHEQLRRGLHLSLKEAFELELVLSSNFVRFPSFAEGVRALLVDKDKQPKFTPATLAEVTPELVAQHFALPWADGKNPLNNL